jgi:hypothetical protein
VIDVVQVVAEPQATQVMAVVAAELTVQDLLLRHVVEAAEAAEVVLDAQLRQGATEAVLL